MRPCQTTCASITWLGHSMAKRRSHQLVAQGRRWGIRCRRATSCEHCSVPRISGSSRTRVRQTAVIPMLRDQTLVPLKAVGFPAIPGVSDPRTIEGPGLIRVATSPRCRSSCRVSMLTATRSLAFACRTRGAAGDHDRLELPSGARRQSFDALRTARVVHVPFARTKAERDARHDPRLSIEERYRDRNDYLQKIQASAARARQRSLAASGGCRRRRPTRDAALGVRDGDDANELGSWVGARVRGTHFLATELPIHPATQAAAVPARA